MGNALATSKIKVEALFEGNFRVITAIQYILNGDFGLIVRDDNMASWILVILWFILGGFHKDRPGMML